MEEDRRAVPRRLLSFDASQMSFSRLGKVLYSGTHPGRPSSSRKPEPASNICTSVTYRNQAKPAYLCLAGNPEAHLAAIASKDNVELLSVDATSVTSLRTTKIGQKYLPTAAQWQGKRQWGHFKTGYVESSLEQPSNDPQAAPGHASDTQRLLIADSGGLCRVYELAQGSSSLSLAQTSVSNGRAINSISFSAAQPNTLATAASDGSVRLWDVRQGMKRPTAVFQRPGDIAREVQFQPENENKFACIHDSGIVQRWDIRQRQSPDFRISAHQQGLSLDWHPHLNYLATGGRDHLVQIWSMNAVNAGDVLGGASSPEMIIPTPNSVSKVKWATAPNDPLSKASIITSGRPIDSNSTKGMYSCWALDRPWIPQYTVEAHSDAVTDIFVVTPSTIWTVGRDGKFAQTDLRYEPRVSKNLPPVLVDWPPWDIAAVSFPGGSATSDLDSSPRGSQGRIKTPATSNGMQNEPLQRKHSFVPMPQTGLHASLSRTMSMANLSTSPSSLAHQLLSTSSNSASSAMPATSHSGGAVTGTTSAGSTNAQTPRSITPGTPTGSHSGTYFQNFGEVNEQFVIEVGLPFSSDKTLQGMSTDLLYSRELGQSHAQVCQINSDVMVKYCLFQHAEVWKMLAVAIEAAETSFLDSLHDKDEQRLAEKWFAGQHVNSAIITEDLTTAAIANEIADTGAVSEDAETASMEDLEWGSAVNWEGGSSLPRSATTNLSIDDSDASPSKWNVLTHANARKRSGGTGSETHGLRPRKPRSVHKDAFHALRDRYRQHIKQQKMPWDFLPLLRDLLWRMVEMGSYVAAVSILLVFREYSNALTDFKIGEIVEAALLVLNGSRSFLAAARIRNVICDDPDLLENGIDLSSLLEDTIDTPDTVCHRCQRSLSDNIAFYARNNAEVGFWYCSRCREMLDGCSYCNEPVKRLAIVMLACGHRSHLHCWEHWTNDEKMNVCPAGCGEIICAMKAVAETTQRLHDS